MYNSTLTYNQSNLQQPVVVKYWLGIFCFLILLIIFVGGATRLTGSGLSIVEWRPITGIIPPLNISDWQEEFKKYQQSPEYQQYNFSMNLDEFKFIYYLEFIHRLLGRIIALTFFLPFIYFYLKKQITKPYKHYITICGLLLAQGFAGWYMVKSGLTNMPHVSHYRLAMHLLIAVLIYHLTFLLLINPTRKLTISKSPANICCLAIIILYLQIFFGALLAGLKGGYIYNDFPLMGDNFIPLELYQIHNLSLSNPVFVQFAHRINAYILVIILTSLTISLFRIGAIKPATYLVFALLLQIATGIITLIFFVPISFALIHQLGAMLLLSALLYCYIHYANGKYAIS